MAAVGGSPIEGGLLLAVYALGMAAPLFLLASLWDRFYLGQRKWLRGSSLRIGKLELHSTSLISGVFFILLGAVFLLFDGTSALPSLLGADTEFQVEAMVQRFGQAVSDTTVLLILGAMALGLVGWRLWRAETHADEYAEQD